MLSWYWRFPLNDTLEMFLMCQQSWFHPGCMGTATGPPPASAGQASLPTGQLPCSSGGRGVPILNIALGIKTYGSVFFIWTAVWCSTGQSCHFYAIVCTFRFFLFFSILNNVARHPVPALLWTCVKMWNILSRDPCMIETFEISSCLVVGPLEGAPPPAPSICRHCRHIT